MTMRQTSCRSKKIIYMSENIGKATKYEYDVNIGQKFRHFKGGVYVVLCISKDSEDGSFTVIYQNIKSGDIWNRPADEFFGYVEKNGERFKRFEPYGEECSLTPILNLTKERILDTVRKCCREHNHPMSESMFDENIENAKSVTVHINVDECSVIPNEVKTDSYGKQLEGLLKIPFRINIFDRIY